MRLLHDSHLWRKHLASLAGLAWKPVLLLLLALAAAGAQTPAADALRKGIVEEDANRDLNAAIRSYEAAMTAPGVERSTAALALFRIAECYRKQGNARQATEAYQRLARDFADQRALAEESSARLARYYPSGAAREYRAILEEKVMTAQRFLAYWHQQLELGAISLMDQYESQMNLLQAQRDLAAFDAGLLGSGLSTLSTDQQAAARLENLKLLRAQIALAQLKVDANNRKYELGVESAMEVAKARNELLDLRRELAAFEAGQPLLQRAPQRPLAPSPAAEPQRPGAPAPAAAPQRAVQPSGDCGAGAVLPAVLPSAPQGPPGSYWQVLAVPRRDAEVVCRTLKDKGFPVVMHSAPNDLVRVLAGPYTDAESMDKAKTKLEEAGFHTIRR
jgi:cell division septation protein DedD